MIVDSHSHKSSSFAIVNLREGESPMAEMHYSAGVHPWNADKCDAQVMDWLNRELRLPNVVAVGECGLDKLCNVDMDIQVAVFKKMVALSENFQKPVIIHCVRAWEELFSIYSECKPTQKWVIHGFRGKPELTLRLIKLGFYLSFGSRFNAESLRVTPLSRLLVESDEFSIDDSLNAVSSTLGLEPDALRQIVQKNNLCVFG